MSDEAREIMFRAYHQSPALLALELQVLFELCEDHAEAVNHNRAVDLINLMCGEHKVTRDDVGTVIRDEHVLACKAKLAGHLARSVLQYARMSGAPE